MKTLMNNYFMRLVEFVMAIIEPSECDYDTEKYFSMSKRELRMALIPHIIILAFAYTSIILLNTYAVPRCVSFVVLLPVSIAVIFTIAECVAIAQTIVTDMTGKEEEYVDPETGETRTLMTYKKIRIF